MVSGKAVNVVAGGYASLIKATEEVGAQSRCLMPAHALVGLMNSSTADRKEIISQHLSRRLTKLP